VVPDAVTLPYVPKHYGFDVHFAGDGNRFNVFAGAAGFLFARFLVEGLHVLDGPPAGVLLVLICCSAAFGGGALGFALCFRWLRETPERKS